MNEREKMISGKIYNPGDETLSEMRRRAHKLSQQYNSLYEDDKLRKTILDELIPQHGEGLFLQGPIHPLRWQERMIRFKDNGVPYDDEYGKPVIIRSNCWIASNVVIAGGVTIGEGCVIGAGSVVTRDISPHFFAAGNPCREIRRISEKDSLKYKTELF